MIMERKEAIEYNESLFLKKDKEAMITLIPELKESEDERTWIINYLNYRKLNSSIIAEKEGLKKAIAWLEKQGEQNLANSAKTCKVEQKPADKVGPKFKTGDWVVSNRYTSKPFCITKICDTHYLVDNDSFILFEQESDWRLWTIQDAKDGDVLACENGWTCIFKTLANDETFSSYCFMDKTKWFCETGSECHTLKEEFVKAYNGKIYPATKEQRDLLFAKMKEAGYVWDFENKKLKKEEVDNLHNYLYGEQKSAMIQWKGNNLKEVIDFTGIYKDGFEKWFHNSWEEYEKYVHEHNNIFKIFNKDGSHIEVPIGAWIVKTPDGYNTASRYVFRQTPAWSEEDETRYESCIKVLQTSDGYDTINTRWVKSLKDRVQQQPKQEWSGEDKKMIGNIRTIIEKYAFSQSAVDINGELCEKEYIEADNWLKSLKERMLPQPKQEWSEEDEKLINRIEGWLDTLCDYLKDSSPECIEDVKNVVEQLQSLRPQNWKPNGEQMKFLSKCIEAYNEVTFPTEVRVLSSLYNDLKKLKG